MSTLQQTVAGSMSADVRTVSASSTLEGALRTMGKARIRHLVVLQDDAAKPKAGAPLAEAAVAGILSDRDAVDLLVERPDEPVRLELFLVRDVMTAGPLCSVAPSSTLKEAASLLYEEKINALVVCEEGQVVGIFTTDDLLAACSGAARGSCSGSPMD